MEHETGTYYLTDFLVRSFDRVVWRGLGLDRHPELRDDYFRHYERVVWLAQSPTPELHEKAEAAAAQARPAARASRDRRHRARTCPRTTTSGGPECSINELPRYEILDEHSMQELERGWRRIVSELGVDFGTSEPHEETVALLEAAGQKVEGQLVKLDPDWILEQVAKAPREFDLQARNPANNIHIGGKHMAFGAVYGCPFVREGIERREATYADFENLVRLSQAFPQLDTPGGTICEPNDKPLDSRHLDMVYALMTLSDKPFMGSVTSGPNAEDTIAMAEMVFGRESLEQTPAIICLINVNSPLRYDERMLEALHAYAKANQAMVITPFLLMGAMSPVSVAVDARAAGGARRWPASRSCRRSGPAARSSSARSSRTPTCSRARRASAPPSPRSACSAPARSPATTGCRSAAAARSPRRRRWTRRRRTRRR